MAGHDHWQDWGSASWNAAQQATRGAVVVVAWPWQPLRDDDGGGGGAAAIHRRTHTVTAPLRQQAWVQHAQLDGVRDQR